MKDNIFCFQCQEDVKRIGYTIKGASGKKNSISSVLEKSDEDIRSLKELIIYGIKGMEVYATHALHLNYKDEAIKGIYYRRTCFAHLGNRKIWSTYNGIA